MFDPIANMWSLFCVDPKTTKMDTLADDLCVKMGKARSLNSTQFLVSRMLANSTWSIGNPALTEPLISSLSVTGSNTNTTTLIQHQPFCSSKTAISVECEPFETAHKLQTIERPNIPQPLIIKPEMDSPISCSAFVIASKWVITSGQCAL